MCRSCNAQYPGNRIIWPPAIRLVGPQAGGLAVLPALAVAGLAVVTVVVVVDAVIECVAGFGPFCQPSAVATEQPATSATPAIIEAIELRLRLGIP